jgi:transposase-like protein
MLALPQYCRNHSPPHHHKRKAKHIAKNQPRGPYRSYTTEEKQFVLNMHLLGKTFASISKDLNIPQKNVVRWCREGLSGKSFNRRGSAGQNDSEKRQILQDIGNVKLDESREDSE